ncbi:hypothetical protein CONCODRAFT_3824 [Conidiobolus coronatus NRRL 28638]|uniref:Uncharacterized protein n=1 Tax=Conidiobolus coronatus (strain ATCC 28846 / CBS 209.66 / NRRL 28638) TaxID=796925 RepID=A0A137PDT3_CONC2|nr:hypothetical protein CONCODRAFT_3824 [Conidiobolus coronatus NRRL 28638]|eukprot:KXN73159.1 hypothetical protein CONCODRAFT_3824 [Conidiobolus coronatus NRRL 28638]
MNSDKEVMSNIDPQVISRKYPGIEDINRHSSKPNNSLIKQYQALFALNDVNYSLAKAMYVLAPIDLPPV